MGEFNEHSFEHKLTLLRDTQDSIQSLSSWCLKNQQHHKKIVACWLKVLKKARIDQRLSLFYLANDVIQHSKRKGYPFVDTWATALQRATPLVRDDKVRSKILRLLKIWDERKVFDESFIVDLSGLLATSTKKTSVAQDNGETVGEFQPPLLFNKIRSCKKFEEATDVKMKLLKSSSLPMTDMSKLQIILRERKVTADLLNQLEDGIQRMETYTTALTSEISERTEVVEMLEAGEVFYDTQRGEAKIVCNAYKNFEKRVRLLKRELEIFLESLKNSEPEICDQPRSPIISPDLNAPSPASDLDLSFDIDKPNEEKVEKYDTEQSFIGTDFASASAQLKLNRSFSYSNSIEDDSKLAADAYDVTYTPTYINTSASDTDSSFTGLSSSQIYATENSKDASFEDSTLLNSSFSTLPPPSAIQDTGLNSVNTMSSIEMNSTQQPDTSVFSTTTFFNNVISNNIPTVNKHEPKPVPPIYPSAPESSIPGLDFQIPTPTASVLNSLANFLLSNRADENDTTSNGDVKDERNELDAAGSFTSLTAVNDQQQTVPTVTANDSIADNNIAKKINGIDLERFITSFSSLIDTKQLPNNDMAAAASITASLNNVLLSSLSSYYNNNTHNNSDSSNNANDSIEDGSSSVVQCENSEGLDTLHPPPPPPPLPPLPTDLDGRNFKSSDGIDKIPMPPTPPSSCFINEVEKERFINNYLSSYTGTSMVDTDMRIGFNVPPSNLSSNLSAEQSTSLVAITTSVTAVTTVSTTNSPKTVTTITATAWTNATVTSGEDAMTSSDVTTAVTSTNAASALPAVLPPIVTDNIESVDMEMSDDDEESSSSFSSSKHNSSHNHRDDSKRSEISFKFSSDINNRLIHHNSATIFSEDDTDERRRRLAPLPNKWKKVSESNDVIDSLFNDEFDDNRAATNEIAAVLARKENCLITDDDSSSAEKKLKTASNKRWDCPEFKPTSDSYGISTSDSSTNESSVDKETESTNDEQRQLEFLNSPDISTNVLKEILNFHTSVNYNSSEVNLNGAAGQQQLPLTMDPSGSVLYKTSSSELDEDGVLSDIKPIESISGVAQYNLNTFDDEEYTSFDNILSDDYFNTVKDIVNKPNQRNLKEISLSDFIIDDGNENVKNRRNSSQLERAFSSSSSNDDSGGAAVNYYGTKLEKPDIGDDDKNSFERNKLFIANLNHPLLQNPTVHFRPHHPQMIASGLLLAAPQQFSPKNTLDITESTLSVPLIASTLPMVQEQSKPAESLLFLPPPPHHQDTPTTIVAGTTAITGPSAAIQHPPRLPFPSPGCSVDPQTSPRPLIESNHVQFTHTRRPSLTSSPTNSNAGSTQSQSVVPGPLTSSDEPSKTSSPKPVLNFQSTDGMKEFPPHFLRTPSPRPSLQSPDIRSRPPTLIRTPGPPFFGDQQFRSRSTAQHQPRNGVMPRFRHSFRLGFANHRFRHFAPHRMEGVNMAEPRLFRGTVAGSGQIRQFPPPPPPPRGW